jgi:hypothetical protein
VLLAAFSIQFLRRRLWLRLKPVANGSGRKILRRQCNALNNGVIIIMDWIS